MMSFYIDINVYRCCYCPLSCVEIVGGAETPFEGGVFSLEIIVPDRYDVTDITHTSLSRYRSSTCFRYNHRDHSLLTLQVSH